MTTVNRPPANPGELFPTETSGLPQASPPQVVRLRDGDRLDLRIAAVANRIGDDVVRMLAYNGSIPGPCLHVDQGSEVTVEVTNDGDVEATVHWHGLRLENRYDGVPHETQAPIPVGGTFTYRLQFPDAGFYWYHPHIREDFGLEMGLYGTIVVEPADASYWPPVDRHLTLTLDDLLVEDGRVAPFRRSGPTYTAMGRFGNVMLTNGQTRFTGQAATGEVVRLYLVNTANTRVFNVALPGARMKLVGGDSGRYEQETFVEEVLLAPSERAVVDVLFDTPGDVRLQHRTPDHTYVLGAFWVSGTPTGNAAASYETLRADPELTAERDSVMAELDRPPDKVLGFTALMPLLYGGEVTPASSYRCPMHPEVTGTEPGTCSRCGMQLQAVRDPAPVATSHACPMHPDVTAASPETCPKCGMRLVASDPTTTPGHYACPMHPEVTAAVPGSCPRCGMDLQAVGQPVPAATSYACPMHPEITGTGPTTCPKCGMKLVPFDAVPTPSAPPEHSHTGGHDGDESDGIEWEDLMPDINRMTDPTNMIWKLVDRQTGAENGAITWAFTVGDRVKIRLVNEMEGSEHPMHHPFHVHGAGRFLVLCRQGVPEPNLVWKDTVLVPAGRTVDVLLDVSNPGLWMAHCHIAEHAQSGMMFSFDVARRPGRLE
jgi:FtsP/CotA-like multicopper oxidase with cupredoxin domain